MAKVKSVVVVEVINVEVKGNAEAAKLYAGIAKGQQCITAVGAVLNKALGFAWFEKDIPENLKPLVNAERFAYKTVAVKTNGVEHNWSTAWSRIRKAGTEDAMAKGLFGYTMPDEEFEEAEAEAKSAKSDIQKIRESIENAIKKIQKLEKPSFDSVEQVKRLSAVLGAIPII